MKQISPTSNLPILIADSTLGKLAKWLRLAGIDIRLDTQTPDPVRLMQISDTEHREVLTRTLSVLQKIGPARCLMIQSNDPMDQARQVIRHFRIKPGQMHPLSRCANCNLPLFRPSQGEIVGQVPDYILHKHDGFMACSECQRIYWSGSHASRITSIIDGWFI